MLSLKKEAFILVWHLNLEDRTFKLLGSNLGFVNIEKHNFKKFNSLIKACYKDYFFKTLKNFKAFLNTPFVINYYTDYYIKMVLPIQLNHNNFTYTLIKVIPETNQTNNITAFYMIATPLKEYDNEIISLQVYRQFKKSFKATSFVKNQVSLNQMFTALQQKILIYLIDSESFTSKHIAICLDKKVTSINISIVKIKDKLSHFFDINFNTITDAITYYKKSFLSNK